MQVGVEALGIAGGGGRTILLNLLQELTDQHPDWCTTIFASEEGILPSRFEAHPAIRVRRVRFGEVRVWRAVWGQFLARFDPYVRQSDVVLTLTCSMTSGPIPSVAYVQNALPFVREPRELRVRRSVPRLVQRRLMLRAIGKADLVVVQTKWFASHLASQLTMDKRIVVERPQPPCSFTCGPSARTPLSDAPSRFVLYVGSDLPHKNLNLLEQAWTRAVRSRRLLHGVELWVAGVDERGPRSTPNIKYLGNVPRERLCGYYRAAEFLVHPSLVETFGLPLLEAQWHGLPVVAPDLAYARETVQDAGLYYEPHSVDGLARSVVTLLEDEALRSRLGSRARSRGREGRPSRLLQHIAGVARSRALR